MRRQTVLTAILLLLLSSIAWSQQLSARITNQDVIDMVGLGLSDDVIITQNSRCQCRRNTAVQHQRQRSEGTQGCQGLR